MYLFRYSNEYLHVGSQLCRGLPGRVWEQRTTWAAPLEIHGWAPIYSNVVRLLKWVAAVEKTAKVVDAGLT